MPYSNQHSFHQAILRTNLTVNKRIESVAGVDLNWNAHDFAHEDIQSIGFYHGATIYMESLHLMS